MHPLLSTARAHFDAGRLNEAATTLRLAATLVAVLGVPPGQRAAVLGQLGQVLTYHASFVTNDYAKASAVLEEALAAARAAGDPASLANAVEGQGLGSYHQALTRGETGFERAAACFERALNLRQDLPDPLGTCRALFHVALIAERAGRFAEAETQLGRALSLAERHHLRRELASVRRHLGFAHARRGDWEAAHRDLATSLALLESEGLRLVLPFAHLGVGEVLAAQARWTDALAEYEIGSVLSEALGLDRPRAQAALYLGTWHAAQGNPRAARAYFEQARQLAEARAFITLAQAVRQKLAQA